MYDLIYVRSLTCPFALRGGVLAVYAKAQHGQLVTLPTVIYERLFQVMDGQQLQLRELSGPADLRGDVDLRTPQDALMYLRLQTSPATFYMMQGRERRLELVDRAALRPEFVFGDMPRLRTLVRARNGYCGVVDTALYRHLGLPSVSADSVGNAFVVERPIVVQLQGVSGNPELRFVTARQRVSPAGEISDISTVDLPRSIGEAVKWTFPLAE